MAVSAPMSTTKLVSVVTMKPTSTLSITKPPYLKRPSCRTSAKSSRTPGRNTRCPQGGTCCIEPSRSLGGVFAEAPRPARSPPLWRFSRRSRAASMRPCVRCGNRALSLFSIFHKPTPQQLPDSRRFVRHPLAKPKVINGARLIGRQFNLQAEGASFLCHRSLWALGQLAASFVSPPPQRTSMQTVQPPPA